MDEINKNYATENGSFIFKLNYNGDFDIHLFKKITKNISHLQKETLDEDSFYKIFKIYSWVLSALKNHFDQNDLFEIFNLPKNHSEVFEEFEIAIETLFKP